MLADSLVWSIIVPNLILLILIVAFWGALAACIAGRRRGRRDSTCDFCGRHAAALLRGESSAICGPCAEHAADALRAGTPHAE